MTSPCTGQDPRKTRLVQTPPTPVVHIVDDDDAVRDGLVALLSIRGLDVQAYASAELFLATDLTGACGCVVTDVQMGVTSGLDLLRALRNADVGLPVIVMTGRAERNTAQAAVAGGAAAFLNKPFGPDEIVAAVQRAIASCAA